jgi:membrane-associated phospholipid phosphatase
MSEDTERPAPPGVPVQRSARQRRPTGAPPPLPHPVRVSTTAWLVLAVVIVACAFLFSAETPWLRADDRANTWILRLLAQARTPWLTDVAGAIKAAGSGWGVTALGLSVVALTMIFRRWRHLLVFLGGLFFLEMAGQWIYFGLSRPRPYGISIISGWGGYSAPSPPVAVLTVFLMGAVYCLVVPGRPRTWAKAVVVAVVALFCLARLYLAIDHPDDVLFAVALGVAIPVIYTFPGGCATYRFDFAPGASQVLATAVDGGVAFMPRAVLVNYVRDQEGLALCGRGASCPG